TEWATRGVRVNAIAPGFFITALNRDKMDPERRAMAIGRTPIGRFGELDELVNAALYLASPGASYVTGETLRAAGRFLAGRVEGAPRRWPARPRARRPGSPVHDVLRSLGHDDCTLLPDIRPLSPGGRLAGRVVTISGRERPGLGTHETLLAWATLLSAIPPGG